MTNGTVRCLNRGLNVEALKSNTENLPHPSAFARMTCSRRIKGIWRRGLDSGLRHTAGEFANAFDEHFHYVRGEEGILLDEKVEPAQINFCQAARRLSGDGG